MITSLASSYAVTASLGSQELAEGEAELLATKSVLQVLTQPNRPLNELIDLAEGLHWRLIDAGLFREGSVLDNFHILSMQVGACLATTCQWPMLGRESSCLRAELSCGRALYYPAIEG